MGRDADEVVELGDSGTAHMYHDVDLSEPANNEAEQAAQQDALEDYIPDDDGDDDD